MSEAEPTPAPSLYDRVGGEAGIEALVGDFYHRVMNDAELAPFFAHVPMEKLMAMQKEFFSEALGGPLFYTGKPLREVHAGRAIQRSHLRLFLGHLLDTVSSLDLDPAEIHAIHSRIALESDEVTGGNTLAG
jgi:hemoglobin